MPNSSALLKTYTKFNIYTTLLKYISLYTKSLTHTQEFLKYISPQRGFIKRCTLLILAVCWYLSTEHYTLLYNHFKHNILCVQVCEFCEGRKHYLTEGFIYSFQHSFRARRAQKQGINNFKCSKKQNNTLSDRKTSDA